MAMRSQGRVAWRHSVLGLLLAAAITVPSGASAAAPGRAAAAPAAKPGKPGASAVRAAAKPPSKAAAKAPGRAAALPATKRADKPASKPASKPVAKSAQPAAAKAAVKAPAKTPTKPAPRAPSQPPAKAAAKGNTKGFSRIDAARVAVGKPPRAGSAKAAAPASAQQKANAATTRAAAAKAPAQAVAVRPGSRTPAAALPKLVIANAKTPAATAPKHVQTQPPLTLAPAGLRTPTPQGQEPGLPYPLGNGRVKPTPGTTASEGYVASGGLARRYIVIKPEPATEGAPVLVLLHATSMTPETMANLTRAGRLAADYGAWVYLPEALAAHWNDSPASLIGADDVAFIRAMIDGAVQRNRLDAARVFVAGYSNGGFMAERVACELSSRIAGGASIAATFRDAMVARCRPTHPMPFALFQGTADILVPYRGQLTLQGAREAFDQWGTYSDCRGPALTTALPDVDPYDGTRVNLTRSSRCRGGSEIRLYTIENGGHTWPDSDYTLTTLELGLTTRDIDATTELWQFMTGFSLD